MSDCQIPLGVKALYWIVNKNPYRKIGIISRKFKVDKRITHKKMRHQFFEQDFISKVQITTSIKQSCNGKFRHQFVGPFSKYELLCRNHLIIWNFSDLRKNYKPKLIIPILRYLHTNYNHYISSYIYRPIYLDIGSFFVCT